MEMTTVGGPIDDEAELERK